MSVAAVTETVNVVASPAAKRRAGVAAEGVAGALLGFTPMNRAAIEQKLDELQVSARGQELGDLFEYKVTEPITIRKNQSALVPIVASDIAAERVSLWNESTGGTRPLRALWLTNASALTLDGGSFTVLEESAFAGEGLIEPIKPGEKRLLSYAVDLGVLVESKHGDSSQRISRVRVEHGIVPSGWRFADRYDRRYVNQRHRRRFRTLHASERAVRRLDARVFGQRARRAGFDYRCRGPRANSHHSQSGEQ